MADSATPSLTPPSVAGLATSPAVTTNPAAGGFDQIDSLLGGMGQSLGDDNSAARSGE